MSHERIKINKYEDKPEWNSLEVKGRWAEWNITSHSDGDVEIDCTELGVGSNTLILNQDELKQVIEFLQSKVIE